MIGTILSTIGLPNIIKAASSALGFIDSDVTKKASKALQDVEKAISSKEITPEDIKEANRHTEKMFELDNDLSKNIISEVNSTIRKETESDDKYVRRWRPTFGYSVAFAWIFTMTAIAYTIIDNPTNAPMIITALVNTSPLWAVALGVLGISVVKRSHDKIGGTTQKYSLQNDGFTSRMSNTESKVIEK